jgi:hypothetical protein
MLGRQLFGVSKNLVKASRPADLMQTVEDCEQLDSPNKDRRYDHPQINDTPGIGYRSKGPNFVIGNTQNAYPITTISNHDGQDTTTNMGGNLTLATDVVGLGTITTD